MPNVQVRALNAAEVERLVGWAAAEGRDPGLDDAAAFRAADPGGFLGLFVDGEMASTISVVAYDAAFGFIGFYICRADFRHKGFGKRIWDAALERLGERTIGLDGVVAQQENYAREGFVLAHRNVRYTGPAPAANPIDPALVEIDPAARAGLIDAIADYDARFFPVQRDAFIRSWIAPPKRRAVAFILADRMHGYGVIRACRSGYKIGPLFADDAGVAESLFVALAAPHAGKPVTLDLPEPNSAARALAERHGLTPAFETARMYRGGTPTLPLDKIFGITSFELG